MLTVEQQRRIMRHARREDAWIDAWGRVWRVVAGTGALDFTLASHAALRAHVFHRDGYHCQRCTAAAAEVPDNYDGRRALATSAFRNDRAILLVLDHVIARAAGGSHTISNLQTLCEACNSEKLREDRPAIHRYRQTSSAEGRGE